MKTIFCKRQVALFLAMFIATVLVSGCGGGGGGTSGVPEPVFIAATQGTDFTLEHDTYGLQFPTFLYASDNSLGLVFRAEIASSEQDMWFDSNILRIDCPNDVAPGTYPLAAADPVCTLTIFNGFSSTSIETVEGTLVIDAVDEWFSGHFEVLFVDHASASTQMNWAAASFSAPIGHGDPPMPVLPVIPADAEALFSENCQGCHAQIELARKGCLLSETIGVDPQHQSISLTAEQIYSLKVLLNSVSVGEASIPY